MASPNKTTLEDKADPLLGRIFDARYRVDARLDQGGMGTVYRGTNLSLNRPVALKVINAQLSQSEDAQERFRQEAKAAAAVQHRNAVTVLDFGQSPDGLVYFVMELLEGRSLRELISEQAPFDSARSVSLMLKIAAAVGAAHDAGLIHRDLKPANVFIAQQPYAPATVKVIDFGLAQLVYDADTIAEPVPNEERPLVGTPRYMSPEQCLGQSLTPAADVYSMGIMLYEMLAGTTPFTGENSKEYAAKHATEIPRSPIEFNAAVPPSLAAFVLRSLAKDPEDRPADAHLFGHELRELADTLGLETAFDGAGPTLAELKRAGRESPSGSLVVDLARLRKHRAQTAASSQEIPAKELAAAPKPMREPNSEQPSDPEPGAEPAISAEDEKLRWEPMAVAPKAVLRTWAGQPMTLLAIGLTLFFLILAMVSWALRTSSPKPAVNSNAPQQGIRK
ncbi:MAG: serine/threonine-protein kinase [Pyrinomonadaceae bacterium]